MGWLFKKRHKSLRKRRKQDAIHKQYASNASRKWKGAFPKNKEGSYFGAKHDWSDRQFGKKRKGIDYV